MVRVLRFYHIQYCSSY